MTVLETSNLCKEYRRNGDPFLAVDNACLEVGEGELIGVVGRSGSGKTTLLNLAAGLLKPTSGGVRFEGADILALPDGEMSRLRNRRIGYVPQGQSLLANLTVFDNVRLPFHFLPRGDDASGRTSFLLDELGISHLADMYPAQLSGGEMRRAAIARAMMNRPILLLADEPTGDLDPAAIRGVMDVFAALAARGVAVVFSTHEDEAVGRADRVVEMASGKLSERMHSEA
ncbi:MAG: ABC transporter ATP-binding protein [Planctomycetota bacterium]|jgi:putative ABC transport system ATP-binding protein|nr:ABC transporter ATP-binding protein [Planctomycetota bacterium]